MNRRQALERARKILAENKIEDTPLESELLLRHTLKTDRVQLYLKPGDELTPQQDYEFWQLVERRVGGEPTAYITGHREFYGLDFHVDRRVLIPRPETELLVEKAISLARHCASITIAEIGTGCGAIAVCLALNLPRARIYATDISAVALEVASLNSDRHGVANRITLLHGDMLAPLPEPVDLIVANLPYIRRAELNDIREPLLALDGGPNGLDNIVKLGYQLVYKLRAGGQLLLEIGQGQASAVTSWLYRLFPGAGIETAPDLAGIERVVSLTPAVASHGTSQLDTELSRMLN
ncbi:MAG TPA: peptide chain release factor N(5)-glutamine methyltransferase [Dehalococcoidia bacterium]|nr:peptide chain release factor N(5)-glutamine methyltransferase [Dehalococcoidia bacterium]